MTSTLYLQQRELSVWGQRHVHRGYDDMACIHSVQMNLATLNDRLPSDQIAIVNYSPGSCSFAFVDGPGYIIADGAGSDAEIELGLEV